MAQPITNKGKAWELSHSIWMLWAIVTVGFLNYISFYYISYRVKQRKWFIAGVIYTVVFVLFLVVTEVVSTDHWLYDVAMATYLLSWIISIFHVFKVRAEYLLRLEAKGTIAKQEIQGLKEKINKEYGASNTKQAVAKDKGQSVREERIHQPGEKKADQAHIDFPININEATEQEIAAIPALGSLLAKKVITTRKEVGEFQSIDHFAQEMNLKPHVIEKVKSYLLFPAKETPQSKQEGRIVDF